MYIRTLRCSVFITAKQAGKPAVSHVMTVDSLNEHPGAAELIQLGRHYFGTVAQPG
jgi:hypothetical protein